MLRRRAFTLVELLVVIAIVGLLSTIAVVSLGSARVKARNAKRIADAKQLSQAFYLSSINSSTGYPVTSGAVCISTVCTGAWSGFAVNATVDAYISPYIANKLTDPVDGTRAYGGYAYNGGWAGGTSGDGYTYPADSHIAYNLEGWTDCGPGVIWLRNASRTECLLPLTAL